MVLDVLISIHQRDGVRKTEGSLRNTLGHASISVRSGSPVAKVGFCYPAVFTVDIRGIRYSLEAGGIIPVSLLKTTHFVALHSFSFNDQTLGKPKVNQRKQSHDINKAKQFWIKPKY